MHAMSADLDQWEGAQPSGLVREHRPIGGGHRRHRGLPRQLLEEIVSNHWGRSLEKRVHLVMRGATPMSGRGVERSRRTAQNKREVRWACIAQECVFEHVPPE